MVHMKRQRASSMNDCQISGREKDWFTVSYLNSLVLGVKLGVCKQTQSPPFAPTGLSNFPSREAAGFTQNSRVGGVWLA